ncbi:MAG: YggT family protein [Desulfohalobiaceae bacterium]|nr:YggT family protein [Desulfohalobiaceae bacterium]
MFVLGNFLEGVALVLNAALSLYFWIIIISAVLSWVNPDPYNPLVRIIYSLTEPVLYKIRRTLPFVFIGGVDLSPIVVLFAIQFLKVFLVQSLSQVAMGLG